MNKFQVKHEAICEDCGAKFFTLKGRYCEKCCKKRKSKRHMTYKICTRCGKKSRMYDNQVMCRMCVYEVSQKEDAPKSAFIGEIKRNARKTGGPLHKIETCPNFDGGSINCVTCEPGSWKFKDCGKALVAVLLMFLAGLAQGYTIKATGYVRAVIVAPVSVPETKADVSQVEYVQTVVYTSQGPTSQVVF